MKNTVTIAMSKTGPGWLVKLSTQWPKLASHPMECGWVIANEKDARAFAAQLETTDFTNRDPRNLRKSELEFSSK